ncbi:MAG TPA: S41 family peptidase [Kiritimatiellia bacterium]|nr:S41 family peptidase [Kiritimatiellia bacterium]HNR93240.1 S41 family peptidase [Kiritimatiellia bacterium]HNS80061.1 S41 family peptidase [Kiritimatiellia bacterium]HPA77910.1 S41 family peptidase [Kiritimatiellia bacterium]HQQ04009.1 S41 family peptidase [Kiritimatiellia bacterium]
MKDLKRTILAGILCAAAAASVCGEEAPATAVQTLVRAMDLLHERGVIAGPERLEAGMLSNLVHAADPGGVLLGPEDLSCREQEARGQWGMPGLHFMVTNGSFAIAAPAPEPCRPGDVLELVDGQGIRGLPEEEVWRLLAGNTSEEARLTVRREGSTEHEIVLPRIAAPIPPVAASEKISPETGYIKLYGCHPGTADALRPILQEWKTSGVYGVVLDLRSAAGASREETCRILSQFFPSERELFRMVPLSGDPEICLSEGASPRTLPTMVLVDETTAGGAELLAAGLQSSETGTMILGRRTAGDFLLREVLELNGSHAMLVASRILKFPDGREYRANEGLTPDIVVEGRPSGATDQAEEEIHPRLKNDPALRRACDLLQGLRVLKIKFREDSTNP